MHGTVEPALASAAGQQRSPLLTLWDWSRVGVLMLLYVLSLADRQVISLVIDPIKADLGITDLQMGLMQGLAFSVIYVIAGLPLGYATDRLQPRYIILGGVLFWSLCTIGCGLATSFAVLFMFRIGVAVGESSLTPAAHATMARSFPPDRLGLPMSLYMLSWQLGAGLAFVTSGYVIHSLSGGGGQVLPVFGEVRSWQVPFISLGVPGAALALLALLLPRFAPRKSRIDAPGTGSIFSDFVRRRARFLLCHYFAFALIAVCGNALMVWGPAFYMRVWRLPVHEVGLLFGAMLAIVGTTAMVGVGWLADRLYRHGMVDAHIRVPLIASALGLPCFVAGWLAPDLLLSVVLITIGAAAINSWGGPGAAALQLIAPHELRGRLTAGFIVVNSLVGGAIGALGPAWLTEKVFADPQSLGQSLAIVSAVVMALALVLLAAALPLLRRIVREDREALVDRAANEAVTMRAFGIPVTQTAQTGARV